MKKIFLLLIIFIAIFISSVPYLLSTKEGKKFVIHTFEKRFTNVFLDNLSLSWFGPQKMTGLKFSNKEIDLYVREISLDINFLKLLMIKEPKDLISIRSKSRIEGGDLVLRYPPFSKANITEINGWINIPEKETMQIIFSGKTTMEGKVGAFDFDITLSKQDLKGKINLVNFPSIALDQLIFFNEKEERGLLTKILGNQLNLQSNFDLKDFSGPFNLSLDSKNSKASISANYEKNKITLKRDIHAVILLTKELSHYVLKDTNPVLMTGSYAKDPIKIDISRDSFSLPIPFDLKKLSLSSRIDIGRMHARNQANLNIMISIMKHSFGSKEMDLWLTPIDIKIENGTLYSSRTDMLIDDMIHLCTWGKIDLINDKVRMYLGIPRDTLRYSFGIKNLPPNYVLKVPMKGSTSNIKIDAAAAASKIAILKTAEQRDLFSQILGIFGKIGDDQSEIPAPKRPFPWE